MTKRIMGNLRNIIVVILAIVLLVTFIKTIYVGCVLVGCKADVNKTARQAEMYGETNSYFVKQAEETWREVQTKRNKLYNSSDKYISWISTVSNFVSVPFAFVLLVLTVWSLNYTYEWCEIIVRRARKRARV